MTQRENTKDDGRSEIALLSSPIEPQGASAARFKTVDGFGALPPEIAHKILFSLPIADVTRVGSLSKSCRAFHLSNPILNFTAFPSESTRTFDRRLQLFNSLDGFFIHRGTNEVRSFSIDLVCRYHFRETEIENCCRLETSRVMDWIGNAIACGVEALTVLLFFRTEIQEEDDFPVTQIEFPDFR